MDIFDIIGIMGALLFFFKIGIHIFIEWKSNKDFNLGTFMNPINLMVFFPIMSEVGGSLKNAKKIGNYAYIISLAMITFFLIWTNLHKEPVAAGG